MSNKLFCTFSSLEDIDDIVSSLQSRYQVLYNKIFVLNCNESDSYLITYNVDLHNVNSFLPNTILVHRKKHTNTLYTINALNELILELNNGILDTSFPINWNSYKNCVLLTRDNELDIIRTKLHKIIEI